jgi:hypothetical protein
MIPGATLALAAIAQQTRAEFERAYYHPRDCVICADMVYVTFFNWLTRQRRELEGLRRESSTR